MTQASIKQSWKEKLAAGQALATAGHRLSAEEAFERLDFPTRRDETWRNTSVKPILETAFGTAQLPRLDAEAVRALRILPEAHLLVFANGVFQPELSQVHPQQGLGLMSLAQAKQSLPELFAQHFESTGLAAGDVFAAMNTAFSQDGVFLHVAKGVALERPIELLNLTVASDQPVLAQTRSLMVLEAGASARVVEGFYHLGGASSLTNPATELLVAANARLDYHRLQDIGSQNFQVNTLAARQGRDSHLACHTLTLTGQVVKNSSRVDVAGQNCHTALNGLYLTQGADHVDNHTHLRHLAPNCQSKQLFKGICADNSSASFMGMVFVDPIAQKTDAYQSNRNIVLSDTAKVHSKPQLEIYADDVKCSHGSTTGRLDPNAQFYLQARGIDKAQARVLLLQSFAAEVIGLVELEEFHHHAMDRVERHLARS